MMCEIEVSDQIAHSTRTLMPDFAYRITSLMHDNPVLPIFRSPDRLLAAAGLGAGQSVLEVGCGPGFFTIPAAKVVGDEGAVYAVDVHPAAIARAEKRIDSAGIRNVTPILSNASDTGLPDKSVDLAFVFGLLHIAGGIEDALSEVHRVLKPDGALSFEKTRGPEKRLIKAVEAGGFVYSERQGRIFRFTKDVTGGNNHG
ncbi:MAG: methyltransferase type 11 [Candidatus Methanogaster sp.]|uniref:Methyltransferase type 11 n=1 Tax=Candidatus Methanogaster sp. TaxID=3386292 RepID=A0AC61L6L7_9EURY|nr:MAG: methyltransferase type 11 [ANME-2 cluster archaeon]